jgi:hypothetical protein
MTAQEYINQPRDNPVGCKTPWLFTVKDEVGETHLICRDVMRLFLKLGDPYFDRVANWEVVDTHPSEEEIEKLTEKHVSPEK